MLKRVIKITILLSLTIISALFFGSCSFFSKLFKEESEPPYNNSGMPKPNTYGPHDNEKMADARMNLVVNAIKAQDKEALISMFSKNALFNMDNPEDIYKGADYLLSLIEGEIISWELDNYTNDDLIEYHDATYRYNYAWIILKTDKDEYMFYIEDCLIYKDYPDEVGLRALGAIRNEDYELYRKSDDNDPHFNSWHQMSNSRTTGIYRPNLPVPQAVSERMELLAGVINNRDKDALISMFSVQAKEEAEENAESGKWYLVCDALQIPDSAEYLFSYIQGELTSWEIDYWRNFNSESEYIYKSVIVRYRVKTAKDEYLFYFIDCTADTEDPDSVGLFSLQVFNSEDKKPKRIWDDWHDSHAHGGIYKPPVIPQIAEEGTERLLNVIKNRDKETLISMFAKTVSEEAGNLSGNADYFFSFIQGDIISWEVNDWEFTNYTGDEIKVYKAWYTVTTNLDKYLLFFDYTLVHIENPDWAGLHALHVIKADEEKPYEASDWSRNLYIGIYNPDNE